MAATSVILDIRANTNRALNEFKRFSAQLDNKFLISGLKLDVVRSALGQINREFQRAIGEQGLASGQSLRAAQNQAALILDTFKGVGVEASAAMSQQFSLAFNQIAVQAGGTAKDVQKALSAAPFISQNLAADVQKQLQEGVLQFQIKARQAGLGEDFGNIARQVLSGQVTARQLIETGNPLESALGAAMQRSSGGNIDQVVDAAQRSRIFLEAISDPRLQRAVTEGAKRAYGFRAIIDQLNATLFNPEAGIFGAVRRVTLSTGQTTTILDETEKLVKSIFGPQGAFVNFFKEIAKIFGLEDPLKLVIAGIQFITRQFNKLNEFINSPAFQAVIASVRTAFERTKQFFEAVYNAVSTGAFDPSSINAQIRGAGESLRNFIKRIADVIRGEDISSEAGFSTSIIGTLVEEVGLTLITLVKEIGGALLPKAGTIALKLVGELGPALGRLMVSLFTSGPIVGTIAAIVAARAGIGALRGLGTLRTGFRNVRTGEGGIPGAINRSLNRPFGLGGSTDPLRSSDLGATGTFHRQVIYYLTRIANCVCAGGFGGGGGGFDPQASRQASEAGRRRTQGLGYSGPRRLPPPSFPVDGPLEIQRRRGGGFGSRVLGFGRDLVLEGGADNAVPGFIDRSRGNVASRFNRRYGSGGTRAVLGRGFRGFGRGALIAGGVAALGAGAMGLFGGGAAQATEFDPETGEPIMTSGQRQAAGVGNVLSGGLEGAMTGAMLGSIIPGVGTAAGAVIGGVIGGVVPLLDEGTRKGVAEFTAGISKSLQGAGRNISDAASRGVEWVKDGFSNIGKWFSNIDWKNVLINALIPGGNATIQGLQGIADFASKLNIFEGIKSGIDSVKGVVEAIRDNLPSWLGGRRALGGPVTRGVPFLVGENGPELFVPSGDGSVVSNLALNQSSRAGASSSSVSANFNVTINVNGGLGSPGAVEELRAPIIAIINEAWADATAGTVTRGSVV
jgi:hypothetical protein